MTSPKRKYESSRQLERQSHILSTAREMLSETGYAGTTMRALAERAGVVPATLYNLYGGKDELLLAAVDDLLVELQNSAGKKNPEPGVDAILGLSQTTGEQIEATPSYAEAMARALFNVDREHPLVELLFARSLPFIREQLSIGKELGQIPSDTNTDNVARHLVGQAWGVIWTWIMGLISLDQVTRERQRSDLMTLIAVTQNDTQQRLRARLARLDD